MPGHVALWSRNEDCHLLGGLHSRDAQVGIVRVGEAQAGAPRAPRLLPKGELRSPESSPASFASRERKPLRDRRGAGSVAGIR